MDEDAIASASGDSEMARSVGKKELAIGVACESLSFGGGGGGTDSRVLDGGGGAGRSDMRLDGTGGGGEGARETRWQSPPKVMLEGLNCEPVKDCPSLNENIDRDGVTLEAPLSLAVLGRTMIPGRAVEPEAILDAVSGLSSSRRSFGGGFLLSGGGNSVPLSDGVRTSGGGAGLGGTGSPRSSALRASRFQRLSARSADFCARSCETTIAEREERSRGRPAIID